MIYLLHIDTSLETGSVCLSGDGELLQILHSHEQKDHASFIQPAIDRLLHEQQVAPTSLAAIAVTSGPGSYTGLRVGMATAKGLCYALNIPLLTIGTFEVMTLAAVSTIKKNNEPSSASDLFCPMIDARRQEVFTALLNQKLEFIHPPTALIIDNNTFSRQLNTCKIFFFGNGSPKFQAICHHHNAIFITCKFDAADMISLSTQRFKEKKFANLAYAEPFYGKEFYTGSHK